MLGDEFEEPGDAGVGDGERDEGGGDGCGPADAGADRGGGIVGFLAAGGSNGGDQRGALGDADGDRVGQAQVGFSALLGGGVLGEQHARAPADEGGGCEPEAAGGFDVVFGGQAEDADGYGSGDDVPAEPPFLGTAPFLVIKPWIQPVGKRAMPVRK